MGRAGLTLEGWEVEGEYLNIQVFSISKKRPLRKGKALVCTWGPHSGAPVRPRWATQEEPRGERFRNAITVSLPKAAQTDGSNTRLALSTNSQFNQSGGWIRD